MSGRGGGGGGRGGGGPGGGGGGRGWGGQPLSQSKEFLRRSAQESGLDERHMNLLSDLTKPELFPDIYWHSSGNGCWDETDDTVKSDTINIVKRTPSTVYIMNKQRELTDRMQRSCHYIRPEEVMTDVIRYSSSTLNQNNMNNAAPDVAVLQWMGVNGKLASDERYFPSELLQSTIKKRKIGSKRKHKVLLDDDVNPDDVDNIDPLHDDEDRDNKKDDEEENNDEDGDFEEIEEEVEEEEGEDYTTNYYESDNDDGGGGDDDNEPTFD